VREEENAGSEGEEKEGSLVRRALIDQQGRSSEEWSRAHRVFR